MGIFSRAPASGEERNPGSNLADFVGASCRSVRRPRRSALESPAPDASCSARRAVARPPILVEIGEKLYLFYYFDYVGDDFAKDMAASAEDPVTRRWWKHTDACQLPLPEAAEKKQIWTDLEPVAPAPAP